MQTAIQSAENQNEAILAAVNELTCYANPEVFKSTIDGVLLDWLAFTEADKEYRSRILAIFTCLKDFLNDVEKAEA